MQGESGKGHDSRAPRRNSKQNMGLNPLQACELCKHSTGAFCLFKSEASSTVNSFVTAASSSQKQA